MEMSSLGVFCQNLSPMLQIVGEFLLIFKIAIPVILIVICIFDIGKAIVSSKDKDNKGRLKNVLFRILACFLLFFLPAIMMIIFGLNSEYNEERENSGLDYNVCYDCLFNPYSDNCTEAVVIAQDQLDDY